MSLLSTDASFHSLALICTFLSENPKDAILTFGPVCRRWHEVMTTQCRDMWKYLCKLSFPRLRRRCSTYHEFIIIAKRFYVLAQEDAESLGLIEKKKFPVELGFSSVGHEVSETEEYFRKNVKAMMYDIERCGVSTMPPPRNKKNQNDDGDIPPPTSTTSTTALHQQQQGDMEDMSVDFSFTCPVLAQNLHRLNNERTEDGLPILFCDICKKKVYTVQDGKKLEEAAQLGRCVRIPTNAAARLRVSGDLSDSSRMCVNVGFVISSSNSNQQEERFLFDMFRRIHFSQSKNQHSRGFATSLDASFVNKNVVEFSEFTNPERWLFHIIKVENDDNDDKNNNKEGSSGISRNPLLDEKYSPERGGWNLLFIFPSMKAQTEQLLSSSSTFSKDGYDASATKMLNRIKVLQQTGRIYQVLNASDSNQNNNDDEDNNNKLEQDHNQTRSSLLKEFKFRFKYYPESNHDVFWNFILKEIVRERVMPKMRRGVMGSVALMPRQVVLEGPTLSSGDGDGANDKNNISSVVAKSKKDDDGDGNSGCTLQ